jgi:hypothetical protein
MIYTFYSFKGGVGRSMALANIAELFYRLGLRVLMIDFDLEAPGLERYFSVLNAQFTTDQILGKRGVIDLLVSYKELCSLPEMIESDEVQQNKKNDRLIVEPLANFCVPIYEKSSNGGDLFLLPAGLRQGNAFKEYVDNVQSFDWQDFYANWDGERFFDWFREAAESFADVVLIDSRTGITEVGGICTHQLADVVLMFVGSNQQNLDGTVKMATSLSKKDLIEHGRKGRKLLILPIPSRIEMYEAKLLDEFANSFKKTLISFAPPNIEFEDNLFTDLRIPYFPYYAYQEKVAVREKDKDSAAILSKAFDKLLHIIVALMPDEIRLELHEKAVHNQSFSSKNLDVIDKSLLDSIFKPTDISSKIPSRPQVETPPLPNSSFIAGMPIDQPRNFFGRQKELKRLFNLLKTQPLQNAAIIGQRKSGKTSLLNYLRHITTAEKNKLRSGQKTNWLSKPQNYRWIFVDFQDVRMAHQEKLLRYLLESMELSIPEPCNLEQFMAQVSENIIVPTVILMDEVGVGLRRCPELDDEFWESLRSLATNQTNGNLAFVLATPESPIDMARHNGHSSPFFNIFGYTTTLGAFTDLEARELINSSPRAFSAEDIEWILVHSGKWPLLVQILCQTRLFYMEDGNLNDDWQTEGLQQIAPFRDLLDKS